MQHVHLQAGRDGVSGGPAAMSPYLTPILGGGAGGVPAKDFGRALKKLAAEMKALKSKLGGLEDKERTPWGDHAMLSGPLPDVPFTVSCVLYLRTSCKRAAWRLPLHTNMIPTQPRSVAVAIGKVSPLPCPTKPLAAATAAWRTCLESLSHHTF